jgi:hypothetical protein
MADLRGWMYHIPVMAPIYLTETGELVLDSVKALWTEKLARFVLAVAHELNLISTEPPPAYAVADEEPQSEGEGVGGALLH